MRISLFAKYFTFAISTIFLELLLSLTLFKLINEIKNLNYLKNNENHHILNQQNIVPYNRVPFNKISSFMINWSNKFVVIALLTISAIALSKQAWS